MLIVSKQLQQTVTLEQGVIDPIEFIIPWLQEISNIILSCRQLFYLKMYVCWYQDMSGLKWNLNFTSLHHLQLYGLSPGCVTILQAPSPMPAIQTDSISWLEASPIQVIACSIKSPAFEHFLFLIFPVVFFSQLSLSQSHVWHPPHFLSTAHVHTVKAAFVLYI